jgi:hypothetical protein
MLTLNAATLPSEHRQAHTLLEIIANPDLAKQHLEALKAETLAATEASENAHKLVIEAKEKQAAADAKMADAMKVISEHDRDHAARVKQLDERHALITATDARLTAYENSVSAREQELIGAKAAHDYAASEREAALNEREAALSPLEKAASDVKETYDQKLAALKKAMGG